MGMTRKQQRIYRKAFRLLRDATPLRTDCGALCGANCCNGDDETGMLLFPGEPTALRVSKTEDRRLAVCGGVCNRNARPLACRIFPFFPFVQPDGGIDVRIDPRGRGVCPLVRMEHDVLFSHRFLHRVRRVGELLCRDGACRAYLLEIQQEIAQQQEIAARFSAK